LQFLSLAQTVELKRVTARQADAADPRLEIAGALLFFLSAVRGRRDREATLMSAGTA